MGAEIYSAATTRDQARIVWSDAKAMAAKSSGLKRRFGVVPSAHSIYTNETGSSFKALSRDQGGNLDGLNVHIGIIDELHAHKTRDVFDVIETATGARDQPLLWLITTAGFNRAGICYEQRAYSIKVLSGVVDDPEYFAIIYTVDDEDLEDIGKCISDQKIWAKANPNWGVSVSPDDIARKARKAREMAAAQNNFLAKHLNVWVNSDVAWMDMAAWDRCADPELDELDFVGDRSCVAADLATKTDIAPLVSLYERDGHYYCFARHYLNEDAAEDGRNSQYSGWSREGRLILTPGNITDYGYIEEDARRLMSEASPEAILFDPWQASYLIQRLQADGASAVEYRQSVQNMSEPMKQLEALVLSGKFHHDGDPVLAWMASNVVCHVDAKENIYPRKEFPQNKIDGIVALIMCIGYMKANENGESVYESRGIVVL